MKVSSLKLVWKMNVKVYKMNVHESKWIYECIEFEISMKYEC